MCEGSIRGDLFTRTPAIRISRIMQPETAVRRPICPRCWLTTLAEHAGVWPDNPSGAFAHIVPGSVRVSSSLQHRSLVGAMADVAGSSWRLDPNQVYGSDLKDATAGPLLRAPLQPWAGEADWLTTNGWPVLPWFGSQGAVVKNCLDPSVVCPPTYEACQSGLDSNRRG